MIDNIFVVLCLHLTLISMPTSVHYLCEPSVLLTFLIVENVRHKITQKPDNPPS